MKVQIVGIADLMFDTYFNNGKDTTLEEKIPQLADGTVILPRNCMRSILTAENPNSIVKRVHGKKARAYQMELAARLDIPSEIVIYRNGQPVNVSDLKSPTEPVFTINYEQPRVIKQGRTVVAGNGEKKRPVLLKPWGAIFEFSLFESSEGKLLEANVFDLIKSAGLQVGVGTYRPAYGRFTAEVIG